MLVRALLAALPVALVVVAMTLGRWRAAAAGSLGLAAALVVSLVFGYGTRIHGDLGPLRATGGAFAEAAFTAATILWIVFPALCLYELQKSSGAFDTIRSWLMRLSDDPRILAILIAWFFALFLEGAAGFGTPIALAAPLLVGVGFTPVQAVTLALIGHAVGVSFGALGTPVLPQIAATGLSARDLAWPAALLHASLGWILVAFLVRLAAHAALEKRHWGLGALAVLAFLIPYAAIARYVGPELPTLAGALLGGAAFALVLTVRKRGKAGPAAVAATDLLRATLPYLVLLVLVLTSRLVPPLREQLKEVVWTWSLFEVFAGRVEPLYHPGTLLFLGFVLGGLVQGRSLSHLGDAAAKAAGRLASVALALVAMLGLSRLMVHAGMIQTLADAAAASGSAWPLLAPAIGVLGTFVTGSATASNILFSEFQEATARVLALPVGLLQGAQNFGAAVGNIICPHNIIAGGATVGLAGREGEVMKATIVACAVYAAAGGLLLMLLLRLNIGS